MPPKKKKKTPEEQIENAIASIVVDSEYRTAASMQDLENRDFESLIDMLECRRNEKDYDWMSDSFIPEMNSIILTDSSQWANQYFQSRDFVEVKLDGDGPNDQKKANAAKKCINKTLNDRDLYYYPKYIRMRTINALMGHCYVLGWWEQELKKDKITINREQMMRDEQGFPVFDRTGKPQMQTIPEEHEIDVPIIDRFNCEVLDPRNVYSDNKYCYTVQQKDWVTVRDETTYEKLKANEVKNNYINLDRVKTAIKEKNKSDKTETAKDTYDKESTGQISKTPVVMFDILDRYGKFWAVVSETDNFGNPTKATPGIDEDGLPKDGAELIEMIVTFVLIGNQKILIRFEPTPFIDSVGKPYKPLARGLCYIHPVKDEGLSDGKNMRELQVNINDTWNMGQDRVKLATLPMFVGKKGSLEDNSTVYCEPEHVIELEGGPDDLRELRISDNISGSLESLSMLTSKMQQVTSTYPHSMGALPDKSSTTATAVAGAETRTNARANYKSLTFEYTMLTELYWMILQMTHRFAHDHTLIKMLGDDAQFFDANADYTYTPITSNIEAEHSKYRKISLYDQTLGRLSGLVQTLPKLVPIVAHIVGRQLVLQGDEFAQIGKMIEDLSGSKPQKEGEQPPDIKDMGSPPTSNQSGMPMSPMESGTRENMMSMGGMIK